ncbi:hypothetical protein HYC85_020276 [Camellia sinensis]|uniref:Protein DETOXIFICATION n=1 Tax=Camellia sinensis TaxID=4442 RepID=A0A7J7GT53_CAMSI|nr:hypothetical protein HYC85_020276 [Camellia sinensis]
MGLGEQEKENNQPLLISAPYQEEQEEDLYNQQQESNTGNLIRRTWVESKKMWHIAGPSIFTRLAMFSLTVITQAFAGHLSDHDLAAISIVTTVIIGITFGFLLGMASALETLCGQAYGAKQCHRLGIYMQRSWVVLFLSSILLLPLFVFATPILKLTGQSAAVAELAGVVALWLIPMHLSFAFQFTVGEVFAVPTQDGGGCLVLGLFCYVGCGGCPQSWTGFSEQAFVGLWDFFKLSVASGVMLSLENFYYRVLIIISGNMNNAEVALDALSICITIYAWESMIPLGFFTATGYVNVCVAVGSGWQALVAFINIGSYYIVGVPLGVILGCLLDFGIKVQAARIHMTSQAATE